MARVEPVLAMSRVLVAEETIDGVTGGAEGERESHRLWIEGVTSPS